MQGSMPIASGGALRSGLLPRAFVPGASCYPRSQNRDLGHPELVEKQAVRGVESRANNQRVFSTLNETGTYDRLFDPFGLADRLVN